MFAALVVALTELSRAYAAHLHWRELTHKETKLEALEDEKLRLLADGTPFAKLRLEVIAKRISRIAE